MSNNLYLLIAGAVLVGSPIVVEMVNSFVPAGQTTSPEQEAPSSGKPASGSASDNRATAKPTPARTGAGEAIVQATPSLDPQGIAPAPSGVPTGTVEGGVLLPPAVPPSAPDKPVISTAEAGPPKWEKPSKPPLPPPLMPYVPRY